MIDYLFVSYAHADMALCYAFCSEIQDSGYYIWVDKHLQVSTTWENTIFSKIDNCQAFVFLVTENSFESEFCRRECAYAVEKGKFIVPVKLAPCQLPPEIDHIQWLDDGKTNGIHLDIEDSQIFKQEYRRLRELAKDTRHTLWKNVGMVHPDNKVARRRQAYRNLQQLDAYATHFHYQNNLRKIVDIRRRIRFHWANYLTDKHWVLLSEFDKTLALEFVIDWMCWDQIPPDQDYYHRRHNVPREYWEPSVGFIDRRLGDMQKFVDAELK